MYSQQVEVDLDHLAEVVIVRCLYHKVNAFLLLFLCSTLRKEITTMHNPHTCPKEWIVITTSLKPSICPNYYEFCM